MGDPLSVTASIVALLQLTATVTGYLKDIKDGAEDRVKLRDEMRSTSHLLTLLQDRAEDARLQEKAVISWTSIKMLGVHGGPLDQLRETLEKLSVKLLPRTSRLKNAIQIVKWPFDKAGVVDVLNSIERQKSLFQLALENDHISLSLKIVENMSNVQKGLTELQLGQREQDNRHRGVEKQNVLAWLSSLEFHTKQSEVLMRRQNGTGQWLLEDATFKQWLDGRERKLWCHGIPGAGKTVIVSSIIDRIQHLYPDPDIGIAFIYCNFKEKESHTLINLIACLLQQLVERKPLISDDMNLLYTKYSKQKSRLSHTELKTQLWSTLNEFSSAFIIIDALDECDEKVRNNLVAELEDLPSSVRILYTSRKLPDIERQMKESARIEITALDADVQLYVKAHIEKESRLQRHILHDPSLRNEIVSGITTKARGMFLLAYLHLDSLAKKQTRKAVRLALQGLSNDLDDTYEDTLNRISLQSKEDVRLANRVLYWITFAVRPLSVLELQHAIAVMDLSPGETVIDDEALPDEEVLVSVCAGIVTVDSQGGIIRLIHYTTQQFFERMRHLKFPTAPTDITKACLRYLAVEANKQRILPALFIYAAQNWGKHALEAPEHAVHHAILNFLDNENEVLAANQAMDSDWQYITILSAGVIMPKLVLAAHFGLLSIVKALIQQGEYINTVGTTNMTALFAAVKQKRNELAQFLLQHGADVNIGHAYDGTPLHMAILNGDESTVSQILGKLPSLELQDSAEQTPLDIAVSWGRQSIVEQLLTAGAQPESCLLKLASISDLRRADIMRLLVAKTSDLSIKTKDGDSVLVLAARYGNETVVDAILKMPSNELSQADEIDATVAALSFRNESLALKIIQHRNRSATDLQHPLHQAVSQGLTTTVIRLVEQGADIQLQDSGGHTELHWAVYHRKPEVVEALLERGARTNAKDVALRTPLHYAAIRGTSESFLHMHWDVDTEMKIIKLLLEHSSDVNDEDGKGRTPLMNAVWFGHTSTVKLLLQHGAKTTIKPSLDGDMMTPLHRACGYGHVEITRLLLDHGADMRARDGAGVTPLQLAVRLGQTKVVQVLRSRANSKTRVRRRSF